MKIYPVIQIGDYQELSSLEHALGDPYRARCVPKWVKEFYNLTWK